LKTINVLWLAVVLSTINLMTWAYFMSDKANIQQNDAADWTVIDDTFDRRAVFHWRSPDDRDGVAPVDVLRAAAGRMQFEQSTQLGSDRNARAIIKVLDAIAELSGQITESPDGIPIIR